MNMIERIEQAEREAEQIRQQGVAAARDHIASAKAEAEEAAKACEENCRLELKAAVQQAEKDGALLSVTVIDGQREASRGLCKAAEANKKAAVDYLMERVEALV